jgi:probable rRNA maturation factor
MPSPDRPGPDITILADAPVPPGITVETVKSLVHYILEREGVDGAWQLGIRFVDDAVMQVGHAEFMGIDEPTDIMTFPYDDVDDDPFGFPAPGEGSGAARGGDLVISVERAAENARVAGWSPEDELFFLIAHGVLHLLGWDDATAEDRREMLERQTTLMSEWRAPA